jgi:hypothetical protein
LPDLAHDSWLKVQYVSQKARFSRCKQYRYTLERSWDAGAGTVLFIGLNPSTADHRQDDPTIRRCVQFAHDWGFSRLIVTNLFAFRATYPEDLKQASDPVGRYNNKWIKQSYQQSQLRIACWGNHGEHLGQADALLRRLPDLHYLKMNRSQQPAHPLYLRATTRPQAWQRENRS